MEQAMVRAGPVCGRVRRLPSPRAAWAMTDRPRTATGVDGGSRYPGDVRV